MKTSFILSFSLFIFNLSIGQVLPTEDIANYVVEYNPATMKKYEYKTDKDYIVEDSYVNYHLPVSADRALIFKVSENAPTLSTLPVDYKMLNETSGFEVDNQFVFGVNNKEARVILSLPTPSGWVFKEVDYMMNHTSNDNSMSYFAAPFMSVIYDYNKIHNPGEVLRADNVLPEEKYFAGYLQYGESEEKGIRKDIFLKMYNDPCYKRPYGVTTDRSPQGQLNPYLETTHSVSGNKLYRSCQHPIHSEYLRGIGLYKEYYQEGDQIYTSQLVAIDEIPIDKYLELAAPNHNYDNFKEQKPLNTNITTEVFAMEETREKPQEFELISMVSNNVPGRGTQSIKNMNLGVINTPKNGSTTSNTIDSMIKYAPIKNANIQSAVATGNYHLVNQGETLYSISKKYNTSVDILKSLNQLADNTIYTGQQLIIEAN